MNKKLIVSSLLVPLVASTGVVVQAEQVDTTNVPETVVENSAQSTDATTVPTKGEVEQAKSELDAANTAVATQEAVVEKQQHAVNTEAVAVTTAKEELTSAKTIAENATDENIAAASQAVTEAETKVTETEQAIVEAQNVVSEQKAAIATQEAVVSSAQENVTSKQAEVTSAQVVVDSAQASLDGTGASQVIAAQETAQNNVTTAETAVSAAQDELASALETDAARAISIIEKERAVTSAQEAATTAETTLEAAQSTAANTQATLDSATSALATAKADYDSINTIFVSDEYVEALKNYELGLKGQYDRSAAIAELKALNASLRAANTYKSNANDKLVTISDVNNLSEATITELSLFASDLMNQVRAKFGTPLTAVTTSSVAVADMVTDIYVSDNYGWTSIVEGSHNDNALDTTGDRFNVAVGENLNTWSRTTTSTNLDHLKSLIYQSMVEFLYNGREWLHARSIAGVDDVGVTTSYIGVDISSVAGATSVHVNDVDSNSLFTGNTFNITAIANPEDSAAIRSAYEQAQSAYNTALTTNQEAQKTLATAKDTNTTAQTALATAQAELSKVLATAEQAPAARIKLATAQEILATAQETLRLANESVANLNSSIQEKQAILAAAKAVLAEKEAALATAKSELATEVATLNNLKNQVASSKATIITLENELVTAKQLLATAKNTLANLQNAPALLAAAQSKYDQANASLTSKVEVLNKELALLADLKATQTISEENYTALLNAYNAYLEEVAAKELKEHLDAEYKAIVDNNGTLVPVVDETGKVVGYIDSNKSVAPKAPSVTTQTSTKALTTQKTSQPVTKTLPSTGDTFNLMSLIGVGLLGLVPVARKRK
ncbi:TPA: SEC10/PgrA surface exclusion domain-containing protein [Streptococcus suis]|uniref:SEC10/PgrA surface exclusion domain-containing protein n=1 Tax=Streptococcus suis TaxID=1307 RepID=UPI0005BE2B10|nr:SEC10/PgrA surface exclusion domain-containing protein [Streptococcus suis]NQH42924.1 SEC10/PgrA surface exclusion domain-containing protein [Streptococcus suis]NQH55266.1 SEC10/PgrA surface exclusion domain-containing protein [Streptococcus suis]NQN63262.1 SEC10/PgrA surface exclusion domain-containing protein [Streptococcus suis]NQO51966.1 SEC10/PgrA surface exclusion domain-containing protein [Streptococcus suis]NQR44789.1 SEC10/PgrA surface exclusion domain-containing protein [Streptoco